MAWRKGTDTDVLSLTATPLEVFNLSLSTGGVTILEI
jgi:hypothetical protein